MGNLIQTERLSAQGKIIGIQPKLTVGAANDQYEQEADRVARQVMTMPDSAVNSQGAGISTEEDKDKVLQTKPLAGSITPLAQRELENYPRPKEKEEELPVQTKTDGQDMERLQRQPEMEEEEQKPVQAKRLQTRAESLTDSFDAGEEVETRLNSSKGGGNRLPDHVRGFMEPRFGVDFSHVRVHTNAEALKMNQDVGAKAFTHGRIFTMAQARLLATSSLPHMNSRTWYSRREARHFRQKGQVAQRQPMPTHPCNEAVQRATRAMKKKDSLRPVPRKLCLPNPQLPPPI